MSISKKLNFFYSLKWVLYFTSVEGPIITLIGDVSINCPNKASFNKIGHKNQI